MKASQASPLLNIGDVFRVQFKGESPTCWKVTGFRKPGSLFYDGGYQVIRCSRTGKEFKQVNGFSTNIDQYLDKTDSPYSIVAKGTPVGLKASTEGKESGKLQRRLNHCAATVDAYIKEIHTIREKLGYSDRLKELYPTDQIHSMWNMCRL
jgi:hypothetical protein